VIVGLILATVFFLEHTRELRVKMYTRNYICTRNEKERPLNTTLMGIPS